jgi:hypothetical protein
MLSVKNYLYITSVIFFIIGFLHLIRLIFELSIVLAGFIVPLWVSVVGVVVTWYLAYCAFTLARRKK